jgi:uncharacterized protein
MKKQIVFIHGGECFDIYDQYVNFLKNKSVKKEDFQTKKRWISDVEKKLGNDFEFFIPTMPCSWNAKYSEWKIWFEKIIPFLKNNVTLVGWSLGGIFLAKYLSENTFPKKIKNLILLAPPFEVDNPAEPLADFELSNTLELVSKQSKNIFLLHSKDDKCVIFENQNKYKTLLPKAKVIIFEDKGHFNLEKFPEFIKLIKKIN